jgi:hypothetical protein
MAARALLRRHISSAWRSTIENVYTEQLINSERGLQVYFCSRLLTQFANDSVPRRIFVEPSFRDPEGRICSPDIVICNTQHIIGVIELKYQPRVRPSYEKDIGTLKWFAECVSDLEVSNERYLGVETSISKQYSLAPDAILCWAGVYKGLPVDLEAESKVFGKRFFCLHAVTSPDAHPAILPVRIGNDL